jgi:hypothetical protein
MTIDNLANVSVKIGFGVDAVGGDYFVLNDPVKGELDNATYLLAPSNLTVDVTESVRSISINRGRERELDEYGTGTATIVFNDDDRTFDPSYSSGPYFGKLTPMRRVTITWRGTYLFVGWTDDWSVTYEPGDNLSRVTVTCVDGFAILGSQELDEIGAAHTGDTSGERIDRVLDLAEVEYPASRDIDTGLSTLGNTTYGANALAYLQACTRAEAGYLFIAADGTLTFRNRNTTLNMPSGLLITDDRSAGVPYSSISQHSSTDLLYTRVTGESETVGTPLSRIDNAAADEFLIRTLNLGTLFTVNNLQTQNIIDYHLSRFSSTELRFDSATFKLIGISDSRVADLLALDLTDIVTVERAPMGIGSISRLSMVDGIRHSIGHGSWITELSFANVDTRSFLVLNDAVFGELNAYRLAF